MEDEEETIAFSDEHIEVVGYSLETLEQESGDVRDRFLSFECDPHLLAHRRVPTVRADNETSPQLRGDTIDVVPHSRRVPVAELDV